MDNSTIRLICAVIAVVLLGLIVLRRKPGARALEAFTASWPGNPGGGVRSRTNPGKDSNRARLVRDRSG
jgi:hypothetical protein